MVFSSLVFLSIFLPVVLILYWIIPSIRGQNILLAAASLLFYAYGEPVYVFLMIASTLANYVWARLITSYRSKRKVFLLFAVFWNIGLLGLFKYTGFFLEMFNKLSGLKVPVPEISLPIGISFFTFQAMSYVIDVYREDVECQYRFFRLLLYISFFPQLIAGPIIKYHDIKDELTTRSKDIHEISEGVRRFIIGLGKKVLIANYLAVITDTLFQSSPAEINCPAAWLGAAAYTMQIYFDFSGYSDMAIGLGRMMGFHFKENFRYPYASLNIRDFWRRWHISLSTWFKEYLYIPLGGNRKGKGRTVFNKFLVFFCTGLWHGANFTFIFWGLFHGFFLMLEEYVPALQMRDRKRKISLRNLLLRLYTMLVVMVGFVFFRAADMSQGLLWVRTMFAGKTDAQSMRLLMSLLHPLNITVLLAGAAGCLPLFKYIPKNARTRTVSDILLLAAAVLCILSLAGGTYNPFIYFRF